MLPEPTAGSPTKSPRGSTRLHQSVARPSTIWYSRAPTRKKLSRRAVRTNWHFETLLGA
jgi:hypothetical protein